MRGCARCGHRKNDHVIYGPSDGPARLCAAVVERSDATKRLCMCPDYIRPAA